MLPRVSTGDRDAVLRQIRWCEAVQKLVNCHCQLEENPVGNVEPMQLVVQYLAQSWCYGCDVLAALHRESGTYWIRLVGTASIVCRAGSMKQYIVRPSVCPSDPTLCCRFAAVGPAGRR